jgi:pimeloyl-ACP methyl ester carboxylesterase
VNLKGQGAFETDDGIRIVYEIQGEGRPLVLIHGWSLNLRMWDEQVPALSRLYRVIRYDRRGFGLSGGHEDTTRGPGDLRALLTHLGVERAHVLGMSQGAWIALSFALSYPGMVDGMILQGPQAPSGFGLRWDGDDRVPLEHYRQLVKSSGLPAFREAWSGHPLMAIPPGREELKERLKTILDAYPGGDFLDPVPQSKEAVSPRMERLSEINVPALVVVGNQEIPFFRIVADALVYALPNARKAVIEGGGHLINMIRPGEYNKHILEFLGKLGRD